MKNIIRQYLDNVESGDAEKVIALFSEDAIIHSPLYGNQPARHFFTKLFADTNRSIITLLHIYRSVDNEELYSAHFRYDWILKNGAATSFECIDIFRFDQQEKIKELTIIYDTSKIRSQLEELE